MVFNLEIAKPHRFSFPKTNCWCTSRSPPCTAADQILLHIPQVLNVKKHANTLKNATDPSAIAAHKQAEQVIQQIEQAILGAGL